jgi:hypothetical protein
MNDTHHNTIVPCWFCATPIAAGNGDPCQLFVDVNDGTEGAQVLTCHLQCFKNSLDSQARSNFQIEAMLEKINTSQQEEENS